MIAVKQNGAALDHAKIQTEAVCKAALDNLVRSTSAPGICGVIRISLERNIEHIRDKDMREQMNRYVRR